MSTMSESELAHRPVAFPVEERLLDSIESLLCCPYCHGRLNRSAASLSCPQCKEDFPLRNGRLDFLLRRDVVRHLDFRVGNDRPRPDGFPFTYPMSPPREDWIPSEKWTQLRRPQVTLLKYVPRPTRRPSFALDLGCGSAKDRAFIESLGYVYVGCDPFNERAPMMADAHALPFRDGSFGVVFALTVMEHFQNPFVATAEIRRILEPGGRFIGTVEQLVPFHMDSYYNMTQYGIYNVLAQTGLDPLCISPATGWTGVVAHYSGSYWRGVPKKVRLAIARSQDRFSRSLWTLRARIKREPTDDLVKDWMLKFAGGFKFVAERRDPDRADDRPPGPPGH
ncbi:MAG: methyltransferase domain-containing protein [Thermoanaerobaculia bacterium]